MSKRFKNGNTPYRVGMIMAWLSLAAIAAGVIGSIERPRPAVEERPTFDFTAVQPCEREDGSGDNQTYPCVWRGNEHRRATLTGIGANRDFEQYVLYVRGEDGCPLPSWRGMPPGGVCYDVESWMDTSRPSVVWYY